MVEMLLIPCVTFYITILSALKDIQSTDDVNKQLPLKYPVCVRGEIGIMALLAKDRAPSQRVFKNNTGPVCKRYCASLQYKFAGTKKRFCFCGNGIKNKEVSDESGTCDEICPGDVTEVCGGKYGISVYHTGYKDITTVPKTTISFTVPKITEISRNKATTNTYSPTPIQSSEDSSSTGNRSQRTTKTTYGNQKTLSTQRGDYQNDEHELLNNQACVRGGLDMKFIDGNRGKLIYRENNTLSKTCKRQCISLQYKLAGTKGKACFCADSIRNGLISATCDYKCPGDEKEVCGGKYGISVINTGFQNTETTAKEATIVTVNTSKISTQNQSRTDISSSLNIITNDSLISETTQRASRNTNGTVSSKREKSEGISTATVVYIAFPVGVVVSGAIALVIYRIVRRRRAKRECNVSYHTNGSNQSCHTSEADNNLGNENLLENHVYNKLSTKQHIDENAYSSADVGTEYGTVYTADSPQAAHTYGCLKTQAGMNPTKSSEYSHMTVTKANPNLKFTDNTYAHIGNDKSMEYSTENGTETDSTYNTLQASLAKQVADTVSKSEGDQDALYDHATAGVGNQKRNNADEYAHLNSVKAEVTTCTGQGNSKVNHVCETIDSHETEVYEEASHDYFILEPKK